jgi:hypothetical protein
MESLENNGTYIGMVRKLTAIRSNCQENAKKMPKKCQGNAKDCQENAKNMHRKCQENVRKT